MPRSGYTQTMDETGAVLIPKELRKKLHLDIGTEVYIYSDGANLIVRKKEFHSKAPDAQTHKIDELGRIHIPVQYRTRYGFDTPGAVFLLPQIESIQITRKQCVKCQAKENLFYIDGTFYCEKCARAPKTRTT